MKAKSRPSPPGDDDADVAAVAAAAAALPVTALRRHVPRGLWGSVPRWFISCRNAGSLLAFAFSFSLSLSRYLSIFFLLFPSFFVSVLRRSATLPVGSSGGPCRVPTTAVGTSETPGMATKKDILLSQAFPRISTKSLFRMHRVPFSGGRGLPLGVLPPSPSVHLVASSDLVPSSAVRRGAICSSLDCAHLLARLAVDRKSVV